MLTSLNKSYGIKSLIPCIMTAQPPIKVKKKCKVFLNLLRILLNIKKNATRSATDSRLDAKTVTAQYRIDIELVTAYMLIFGLVINFVVNVN